LRLYLLSRQKPYHLQPKDATHSADKMICLSYTLLKSPIPAALSFKLIGAAINVWPLKETPEGICLYHQAACQISSKGDTLCRVSCYSYISILSPLLLLGPIYNN
jgi:hypothetical protein